MRITATGILSLYILLGIVPSALAYGDPAAGAFVLQAVLAGALAGVALLRGQMARFVGVFRLRGKHQKAK
jgi:hypothetical protein